LGPLADVPRFGVAVIRRHRIGVKVVDEGRGLLIDDVTFGHCRSCNLHPFGKADTVVDEVQAIAIDPAVVTAFAPGGIRIEVAELVGNPPRLAVALVPDGPLGLEQALIRVESLTGELGVEVFGILPQKGNKVLQDEVEVLIGPNLAKPQKLAKSTQGDSPTGLEHAPQVRFSCLTTRFASIPPLVRRGLSRQDSQNFAVYPLCVLSCCPERRFARSGQQDGQIPGGFSLQNGFTWPKNRPSLG
jgi:hypothetical protein